MNSTAEEKDKNRQLMLKEIYDRTNGRTYHAINVFKIGTELGWDYEDTEEIFKYLYHEGFLKPVNLGGGVMITHSGVKKAEQNMEHPQNSTQHFPPTIVNNYTIGQAGAVGPNSHAHDMILNQTSVEALENADIAQLTEELSKLRKAMKENAIESEPQVDIAIGEIAKAEQAAKEGDREKIYIHLKNAGKWAFDVATKIEITLVADFIKKFLF